jgi:hypothetical protein
MTNNFAVVVPMAATGVGLRLVERIPDSSVTALGSYGHTDSLVAFEIR